MDPLRGELDEAGIERAAQVIASRRPGDGLAAVLIAEAAIEAYLTEPVKWPTREMIQAACGTYGSNGNGRLMYDGRMREVLEAAWEVDPRREIVEAAIAHRDFEASYPENYPQHAGDRPGSPACPLCQAVNEAGL